MEGSRIKHIVASLLYNGEPIIAQYLKLVYPFVDKIYVSEANETFRGAHKEKLHHVTNRDVFAPYMDKIVFITLSKVNCSGDEFEKFKIVNKNVSFIAGRFEDWYREYCHRNACSPQILQDYHHVLDQVLCIFTDVDEIPDMRVIRYNLKWLGEEVVKHDKISLEMHFLYYNWEWCRKNKWMLSFACSANKLMVHNVTYMRWHIRNTQHLKNAGWHCSYFMSPTEIVRKLGSFSESKFDTDEFTNLAFIEECTRTGKDLLKRGVGHDCVPFDPLLKPEA